MRRLIECWDREAGIFKKVVAAYKYNLKFSSGKLKSAKNLKRFIREEAGLQPGLTCLLTNEIFFVDRNKADFNAKICRSRRAS